MSEPYEAHGTAAAPLVHVPVDLVEFEARLAAIERRLREQEARDQALLGVAQSVGRLTEVLRPLLEAMGSRGAAASPAGARAPTPGTGPVAIPPTLATTTASISPAVTTGPATPSTDGVTPDRLALAQARICEGASVSPPTVAPPSRRSWLLRVTRRVIAEDPAAAGRLLLALSPAHRLAGIEPVGRLPGPPETVARVLARGRLGRRLGWEMAQLDCDLRTISALARLFRLRASPAQLHSAGVRLDAPLTLLLAALSIDPRWTLGHHFTLAHRGMSATYLQVRNGARPSVSSEVPAGPVSTTVRCPAEELLVVLAGDPRTAPTVQGEPRPLELVRQWFARATRAR